MATQEIVPLEELVATRLARVAEELRLRVANFGWGNTIQTGSWSNDRGIVTAYVTVHPVGDVAEEAIEAVITLVPSARGVRFTADVCTADGEILAAIASREIVAGSPADLASAVADASEAAGESIAERLNAALREV
jgi:hypothetical protein